MSEIPAHRVLPLFQADAIAARVDEMAADLARAVPKDVTVVALLKGAFVFTADLVRALDRHGLTPEVEFLQVSSYGLGTASSGKVKVIGAMPDSVGGRDVLLVDDIQDTARTLAWTRDLLVSHGANSVRTCALLDKPSRRQVPFEADHIGFTIEDWFVVGYGIDWAERYRHLSWIGRVEFDQA
ncbi:hypoxanthine phosphoribosyltransferase [Geminicoccus roseus]|uniref:hypoxanthine phosphoribosyltransferase n=1 Tax=Geminicoccus roseus TaxID=404900 RepID=UPI00041C7D05|nr:hypoxanthine phosphoribosyltransferase [Geminicoccus roseus]